MGKKYMWSTLIVMRFGRKKWSGYTKRMNQNRMTKSNFLNDVDGRIKRDMFKKNWINEIGILRERRITNRRNRRAC